MWQQVAIAAVTSPKNRKRLIITVCLASFFGPMIFFALFMMGVAILGGASGTFGASTCTEGYTPSTQIPNPTIVHITYTQGVQLNVSRRLMEAGFAAFQVESAGGRMYANSNVPQSLHFKYDAIGSDHFSVNQFQQQFNPARPKDFPWASTIEEAMDPAHAARAFFNEGIKLEKQGFSGTAGQLAQKIQRSAYPGRYDQQMPEAKKLLDKTIAECAASGGAGGWVNPVPGAPLTSPYGMRWHPVLHFWRLHDGVDFGANCGVKILAANNGTLSVTHPMGYGNLVSIQHSDGSVTQYGHVQAILAPSGPVKSGQVIAEVGTLGTSTGCHLHFIVRPQGFSGPTMDPVVWYKNHGVKLG